MHLNAQLLELLGDQVGNYSRAWMLHCEAKWVLERVKDKYKYLDDIERIRGQKARKALREVMLKIHYKTK